MDSNKTSQSKSNNQSKMTVEDAFKQATDHFIANRYSEADKLCTTILQIAPNLIDALNLSGLIAQKINSHDLAVEQFKKAINFDNNRALLHYNLGISLYALNQKEDSIEVLKIALKKEPGNSLIINCLNSITDKTGSTSSIGNQSQNEMEFLQRAVEFHQSGQIDDAIHWYLKTLAINPESSIALSNMGVALQTLGKLEEAILSYQKAISIDPDYADACYNLGVTLQEQGKLEEAILSYQKAIHINPDYTDAYSNLGNALQEQGKLEEAIISHQKAISLNPGLTEVYSNLGNSLQEQGKLEEAIISHKKAISLNPDLANAHSNLGLTLQKQGKLEEAIISHQKAIAINPDHAEAYYNLGVILQEQGKLEEAILSYQKAIAINPDFTEAYSNHGLILQKRGKLEEAIVNFQKAISINPDYAEAYSNIGNTLVKQGKLEEATISYQKAIFIKPDFADAMYNLHAILCDTDQEAAIKCLVNALKYAPDNMKIKFFLDMLTEHKDDTRLLVDKHTYDSTVSGFIDSWQYIKSIGKPYPCVFGTTKKGLHLGINHAHIDGLVLEFGVWHGATIRLIASWVKQDIHGFDTFQGLPESWHDEPEGSYSTHGELPIVPENVFLHAGLFEKTLPSFLEKHDGPVSFLNIDCDLYSSTKTVLNLLADRIVPGTVIVFDEYLANDEWREDEYKAFQESVKNFGWSYEYLAFSVFSKQAVIVIK